MNTSRTKLETAFGRAILPLARRWRAAADRTLAEIGLSHASGWVLIHIGRLGDAVRQSDLAAEVDVQGPSLVRIIDLLESDGLAVRRLDEADRRINRICLTEAGRAVAERIEGALLGVRRRMLAGIEDDRVRIAVEVLQTIDRHILEDGEAAA